MLNYFSRPNENIKARVSIHGILNGTVADYSAISYYYKRRDMCNN